MSDQNSDLTVLGWEEWVALPDLEIPAIVAKIDTGARTSALHAYAIEPFGGDKNPHVRFKIHPIPDRPEIEMLCSAKVADRREVTSSNGESELRYVIETHIRIGDRRWPIEVTLTNRDNMQYRMLLGRRAIGKDMIVNPNKSHLQEKLSYDLYAKVKKAKPSKRTLRICLLTREPNNFTTRRIVQAAEERGHVCEVINTTRCYMNINSLAPEVHYDGRVLPQFDAVIPRVGTSVTAYGMAVVRQFDLMGAFCVNKAMATQGKGVVLGETRKAAESVIGAFRGLGANFLVQEFIKEAAGADLRCLVIGGKVVAAMMRQAAEGEFRANVHQGGTVMKTKLSKEESAIARKAAKVIGLGICGVDILRSDSGPKVLEINSSPGFEGIERATGLNVAGKMIEYIESKVGTSVRRRPGKKPTRKDIRETFEGLPADN